MAYLKINGPELGTLNDFNALTDQALALLSGPLSGMKRDRLERDVGKALELVQQAREEARKVAGAAGACYEILTPQEYADKYAEGITVQAVAYAMDNGYIDYTRIGENSRNRYVVMTEKTQAYAPNTNTGRPKKGAVKAAPAADPPTPKKPPFKGGKAIMAT